MHGDKDLDIFMGKPSRKRGGLLTTLNVGTLENRFRRRKSVLSEIYEKEIEDLDNAWTNKACEQIVKDTNMSQEV